MYNTNHTLRLFDSYPYRRDSEQVMQHVVNRETLKFQQEQTKDFAFLSANLGYFMPHLSIDEAYRVHMQLHVNRAVMMLETQQEFAADWLDTEHSHILTDGHPKIYCTYHLGAYRAPIALLVKKQVNFVLLIDNNTIRKQSSQIEQQIASIKQQYASASQVVLLNAEKDNVIYKLREYIQAGFSILAYIDGNTGQQGVYHRDSKYQIAVPFLEGAIMARAGLAAIAWLTNLPIYPIISYRPNVADNIPIIEIAAPLHPDRRIPFKDYIADTTVALYKVLEDYVSVYYEQWEPWFYIHRYLPQQTPAEDNETTDAPPRASDTTTDTDRLDVPLQFNQKRYALFKIEDECYLLDKVKYLTYPLPADLYQALKTARNMQTTQVCSGGLQWSNGLRFTNPKTVLDSETVHQLRQKQVFVHG